MKKLALTSLLAVFAISGANAANVIDGNPLYMPGQNHFYSVTTLGSHTEDTVYTAGEEFGYGILNNWAVNVETAVSEDNAFDNMEWDGMRFGTTFRALDLGAWKLDLMGSYTVAPVWGDHEAWLDEDQTRYEWMAGVRGGFVASNWTVAGRALFEYTNTESFNWGDEGMHALVFGLTGQYVFDSNWSVLADIAYRGITDDKIGGVKVENAGEWTGELAVNYNIDATKYVGLYINGAMDHWKDNGEKGWEVEDGFGYGVRFGIDF